MDFKLGALLLGWLAWVGGVSIFANLQFKWVCCACDACSRIVFSLLKGRRRSGFVFLFFLLAFSISNRFSLTSSLLRKVFLFV